MGENRHLQMSEFLSLTLGSFPWALFDGDCTLKTINKAALAREKHVLPAETIPEHYVTITGGISLVEKMKGNYQQFFQHADSALTHILREGVRSHRIDGVFDMYREDSIKNAGIFFKSWFHVTGSSNGECFLAARPTRPTS